MITGLGTDIADIARVKKTLERDGEERKFCKRFFTEAENEYFASKNYSAQTVAACFAAKEAFSKLPDGKIPKVKDLNEEFARLLSEKKAAYSEYKKIKKEMRDYQIAKQNVESFYAAQQSWDIEEDMKKKRQQER